MKPFSEYRNFYLGIQAVYFVTMALLVLLWAVLTGPLYEVYVDISVNPPELIRKTDFSWITVNEWFTSQSYIITSHSVLQKINTRININKLKKIISAKRLGGADIIRISARSNDKPHELESAVLEITSLYLAELNALLKKGMPEEVKIAKSGIGKIIAGGLYDEQAKLKNKIYLAKKSLEDNEAALDGIRAQAPRLSSIKIEISRIDDKLDPLNQKLADLRVVYAEGWHEIIDVKEKIESLEKERSALYIQLPQAQRLEDEKLEAEKIISDEKQAILGYQNRLQQIETQLEKAVEAQEIIPDKGKKAPPAATAVKEDVYGYIINPPTLNLLPELGIRALIGATFSVILWFLLGLVFKRR